MSNPTDSNCEHIFYENGIHEFILRESRLESAYAYLAEIEPIYAARHQDSPPLRVIINSTGELLPLNYRLLQRTRELLAKYPDIGTSYTAILTNDAIDARLANLFIRMIRLPGLHVRFFNQGDHDNATEWLLQGH